MFPRERLGKPKTDAERRKTHERKYGKGSKLPPRGTGLRRMWGMF